MSTFSTNHLRSVVKRSAESWFAETNSAPGEILLEEFLTPMGISGRPLASDIDVPPSRISEIVHGTRPITADTAVRLGVFFKMIPRFWMNLQTEYDMRVASRELTGKVTSRIRVYEPEPA